MKSGFVSQKLKHNIERILLALAVASGVAAAYFWGYDVPARQYRHDEALLAEVTEKLLDSSRHIADTDTSVYFIDAGESLVAQQVSSRRVTELMNQHTRLQSELQIIATHTPLPYLFGLTRDYTRAQAHKARAMIIVEQGQRVLGDYLSLIDYLGVYSDVRSEYIAITERFGATMDLNVYAGMSSILRSDAASIAALAGRLASVQPPSELLVSRDMAVAILHETAAGFGDLADGVDAAIDSQMDVAARRIDTAAGKFYSEISDIYPILVEDSNIMKEVGELPDKYTIEPFE